MDVFDITASTFASPLWVCMYYAWAKNLFSMAADQFVTLWIVIIYLTICFCAVLFDFDL